MARGEALIGREIGSYRVLSLLGSGGMGAVYLAEHRAIGHKAAIKVLLRELASDPEAAQRFFNEARAVNLVKHPCIVQIFDYGQAPDVGAYLVMEYLEGQSLGERLRTTGPLPAQVVVRLLYRVCAALGAAHKSGLIHRDLKPDNIFLVPDAENPGDWRVKVLDFGIAKLLHVSSTGVKTQTGTMVGTPQYMAPEYVHGGKAFDHRIDIYSLGIIAFEALCGVTPFRGEGFGQILLAHMTEPPPSMRSLNPAVPAALEAVVGRALEKDPAARFATMDEMGQALLGALSGESPSAPLRLTATAPAVSSAIALQHTARAPSHPSLAVRAPSLRADPRAPARAPAPAGPPSQELDQGVPVPALQAGAEPVELDAVATAVSTPPEMRRSAQTVIKPHPVESAAVSTSRIAAAPEANVPSTLSVTAAELRRVDPPAAGRRSWALVVGLAVAGVIAAGGTVVVLSLQGGTGDDDAAGMRAPRPAARDTDRAPEAHTAAPVAPPESAPAASPGTASAAPTAKADALTAKPSAAPKKIAARPAGAKKPVAKKGTAKPKFDLAD